jgi:hypothetical protein
MRTIFLVLAFVCAPLLRAEETSGEKIKSTSESVLFEIRKAARFTADGACKLVKNGKCMDEVEESKRRNAEEEAKLKAAKQKQQGN